MTDAVTRSGPYGVDRGAGKTSENATTVAEALGDWSLGDGPLYLRLADSVEHAVKRRRLRPGDVLPPERQFALALRVGRSTVVRGYELLRERGVVESRQGSGTWIKAAPHILGGAHYTLDGLSTAAPAHEHVSIDLATASFAADVSLHDELVGMSGAAVAAMLDGTGYTSSGAHPLREMVADQLTSEGLPTTVEQLLITSGAQQSISLIARRFLAPADEVVLEDPTSAGALDIFSEAHATIRAASGHLAEQPDDLIDTLRRSRPALIYLGLPSGVHGFVAPPESIQRVANAVERFGGLAVEDAGLRDLVYGKPPPYLAACTDVPVLTVGSMSKLFWGGLRVGWIRGPESLIEGLVRTKARADLGTSVLSQQLVLRLLHQRDAIRDRRISQIQENLDLARVTLSNLTPHLEWQEPQAGLTIWARLPQGTSTRFARHAHSHGVRVAAGEAFSFSGRSNDRVRISLAPSPPVFEEGLRRLASAWMSFVEQGIGDVHQTSPSRLSIEGESVL